MPITSAANQLQTTRRVKICGVTQREQALAIAELGADFIGLNFWPGSKRYCPVEQVEHWWSDLPPASSFVGVFVNADLAEVCETAERAKLSHVQLHGEETPDFCATLSERGLKVLKAFQVRDEASLDAVELYPTGDVLLDAFHPIVRGGIGQTFPWSLALAFKRRFPNRGLWLAGGLTPGNVAEAACGVRPFAMDVASGVEDGTPGLKNLALVERFIREAKGSAPLV
ncbi:MAG: phosphoribosylanthranilate isomerase [Roseimicrobium sp.]